MQAIRQTKWTVVDFNQSRPIERALAHLEENGFVVHTIQFSKNRWDSVHGAFHRVGTIVAYMPEVYELAPPTRAQQL